MSIANGRIAVVNYKSLLKETSNLGGATILYEVLLSELICQRIVFNF